MNLNVTESLENEIFLVICLEITLSRGKDLDQVRGSKSLSEAISVLVELDVFVYLLLPTV